MHVPPANKDAAHHNEVVARGDPQEMAYYNVNSKDRWPWPCEISRVVHGDLHSDGRSGERILEQLIARGIIGIAKEVKGYMKSYKTHIAHQCKVSIWTALWVENGTVEVGLGVGRIIKILMDRGLSED